MKTPIEEIFKTWPNGVCHRGLHDLTRPENSRAAFEHAIECGLPFECDINLTKDHRFIVNHDGDLKRVADKEGNISDLTVEEIQRDYKLFDGSCLITLEELIELWDYKVPLVLEIKVRDGQVDDIIKYAKPVLDSIKDKSKIVLISFNGDVLKGLRDTNINIGRLYGKSEWENKGSVDADEFDFIDSEVRLAFISKEVRSWRKKGKLILTWTVTNKFRANLTKKYANVMTFELIDSSKPLQGQKINQYLAKHVESISKR